MQPVTQAHYAVACLLVALCVAGLAQASDVALKPVHVGPATTLAPAVLVIKTTAAGAQAHPVNDVKPATTSGPVVLKAAAPAITTLKPIGTVAKLEIQKATSAPSAKPALAASSAPAARVSPVPAAAAAANHTTTKPAAPGAGSTAAPVAVTPAQRIRQYLEPVCIQQDKLHPKQLFKVQAQLKQFVVKTNGKMSLCFLKHFSMDPSLSPATPAQLKTICAGIEKGFLDCAGQNYDNLLDAELVDIGKVRAESRAHLQQDSLQGLTHDDDEVSMISQVVNKVLTDSDTKSSVKLVEVGTTKAPAVAAAGAPTKLTVTAPTKPASAAVAAVAATAAPTKASSSLAQKILPTLAGGASNGLASSKILNDPNTLVLFVDDSVGNVTTVAPKGAPTAAAPHPTAAPAPEKAELKVTPAAASTAKPATALPASSTGAPLSTAKSTAASTGKPEAGHLADKIVSAVGKPASPATAAPLASTTAAPTGAAKPSTSTGKPSAAPASAKPASGAQSRSAASSAKPATQTSTTLKPLEVVKEVLKKEDREKSELDRKHKAEREKALAAAEKKQEESEAQKAIKSLQLQRAQAHGGPSDIRMHQIEHERQMAIDPIGHSVKHQQYELAKQKRAETEAASAGKSTTTSPTSTPSTTKKPQ